MASSSSSKCISSRGSISFLLIHLAHFSVGQFTGQQTMPSFGGGRPPAFDYWDYGQQQQQRQQQNAFNTAFQQQQQFGQPGFMPSRQQPSAFGHWNRPAAIDQHYFQPPPPPPASPSSSHQLPYASYRGSAFAAPTTVVRGVDQDQRERLARIADESESFGSERTRAGFFPQMQREQQPTDGLQRILGTLAENMPKIAETMAKLGGMGERSPSFPAQQKEKLLTNEQFAAGDESSAGGGAPGFSLNRREYKIGADGSSPAAGGMATTINSMPEPSSLFSFNKLLSAFGAGQQAGQKSADGFDLKGTPVLKSEDLDPELLVHKGAKEEQLFFRSGGHKAQQQHLTPPPELPSAPQNPFNSFLQQFGLPNFGQTTTPSTMPKAGEAEKERPAGQQPAEEAGDLFGSLMKGKLPQMPDWLRQFGLDGMFGGPNGTAPRAGGGQEEPGNALAQLLGGGGGKAGGKGGFGLASVLGSGLEDIPRRR